MPVVLGTGSRGVYPACPEPLKVPGIDLESGLKTELAIHLYREGLLTEANACRLAGIPRLAFAALLGQRKIPIHGHPADLDKDLQTYQEWKQEQDGRE